MSSKLKSQSGGECGYFLCGNIAKTGDPMVVTANKQVFNVTPPAGGELWVTLSGRASDIRVGDDARVSLAIDAAPARASVVNLYRRDEEEASSKAKSTAKTAAKEINETSANDSTKAVNRKSAAKNTPKNTSKSDSRMPHSAAETQFTLGMNMLANGNRERAIDYFNKARELDTSNAMRDRVEAALEGKPIKSTESKENK